MADKDPKERAISIRVDPETEKYLDLAVRHDFVLYEKKGLMRKPNLSEWVRFLINARLNQIISGKGGN